MFHNDEDLEEYEYPDEPDDDLDETMPCPHCGAAVYDDAERCPKCGTYLSREDAPRRFPWWFIVGFLLSMLVVSRWILH